YLRGDIYLDMNNDGSYEKHYTIDQSSVGADWDDEPGTCPGNTSPHRLISIGTEPVGMDQDGIVISVNPKVVHEPNYYTLGGRDIIHCSSTIPAAVALVTLREECVYPPTGQREPMVFLFDSEEGFLPCNCGITKPGNFVIESWDTTLTGLLTGKTTAELAGSTTCACNPDSVEGCARAYLDMEFKVLMGSFPPQSQGIRLRR
ncbi:MAG: hypothetical protein H6Q28_1579, partial [Bacteroidetes bacterium]|nr:hypothetical protein [Bacteroidota bacterium]